MPTGVVTCSKCGRELRAGLLRCPHDGTPLGPPAAARPSREDLLRGTGAAAKTILHDDDSGVLDTAPTYAPLTGRTLGDYVVGGVLGTGGMGEVYEGEQPLIGKKVAIKVLKPAIASDEVSVSRMLAEARAVSAIRHRGIVDIFNFGKLDDGRPYLVMEYLDGEPLDQILRKRVALSPLEAVELLEEITSALAAAHGRGIVHRDLKPANVFVITDSTTKVRYVKLLDFGLAKDPTAPKDQRPATAEGFVVGTPDYIAPEQARGIGVSPKSDLYSLGVMAFEMVSGQLPFMASSAIEIMGMHVNEPAPSVSSVANGVPPLLEKLIAQLLQKDPAARPESAEVVRRKLVGLRQSLREGATLVGESPAKKTEPFSPMSDAPTDSGMGMGAPDTDKVKKASDGKWALLGAVALLVSVALAGVYFLLLRPTPTSRPPLALVEVPRLPTPGESSRPVDEPPPSLAPPTASAVEVAPSEPEPGTPPPPPVDAEKLRAAKLKARRDAMLKQLGNYVEAARSKNPGAPLDPAPLRSALLKAPTLGELDKLEPQLNDWKKKAGL